LTNTKIRKNTNNTSAGQVSIEALLLWAALAGMIAVFTPAFAHAMDAYILHAHTNQFITFSEELQEKISGISFAAPGTQVQLRVPTVKNMEIEIRGNEISLTLAHGQLSREKKRTITSAWPLEGSIQAGEAITLRREEGKITLFRSNLGSITTP